MGVVGLHRPGLYNMETSRYESQHDYRTAATTAGAPGPSRNPTGSRARTLAHYQAEDQAAAFAGLPPDTDRFTVIGLLKEAGQACGWNRLLIDHLDLLIGYTRPQDWRPGGRPLVWLTVREAGNRLGISACQVSRNENRMMRLGALAFRDSGNCRRFGHRDSDGKIVYAYGPNLSPVAALIPKLTVLAERLARESAKRDQLRHAISAARRRALTALTCVLQYQLITEDAGRLLHDRITTLGARVRSSPPLETLRRRLAALEDLDAELATLMGLTAPRHAPAQAGGRGAQPEDREGDGRGEPELPGKRREGAARQAFAAVSLPPDSAKVSSNMQGPAKQEASPALPSGKPLYYYNTNNYRFKELPVAQGDREGSTGNGGPATAAARKPGAAEDGGSPGSLGVSFNALIELVPPAMRAWLPTQYISWDDLINAAGAHAAELGISQDAWGEACLTLGRQAAAIALIVIGVKHDRALIAQPGGYLRAMTGRAATGELHLMRSVYGLLKAGQIAAPRHA